MILGNITMIIGNITVTLGNCTVTQGDALGHEAAARSAWSAAVRRRRQPLVRAGAGVASGDVAEVELAAGGDDGAEVLALALGEDRVRNGGVGGAARGVAGSTSGDQETAAGGVGPTVEGVMDGRDDQSGRAAEDEGGELTRLGIGDGGRRGGGASCVYRTSLT